MSEELVTVRDAYNSLDDDQKELLELVLKRVRDNPLNSKQVDLFANFMAEASYGSMTKVVPVESRIPRWMARLPRSNP